MQAAFRKTWRISHFPLNLNLNLKKIGRRGFLTQMEKRLFDPIWLSSLLYATPKARMVTHLNSGNLYANPPSQTRGIVL